jgi:hypothetical protein
MNEEKLRHHIRRMLIEEAEEPQSPKPKKKKAGRTKAGSITASTGRGRFSTGVQEAGALAKDNPNQLMKNLKISSGAGGDLRGIASILKQALKGAEAMQKAYSGYSEVNKGDKKGIKVSMAGLDPRNGVKYLQHTLVAAKTAGLFRLKDALQIDVDGNAVIIYLSDIKRGWSK